MSGGSEGQTVLFRLIALQARQQNKAMRVPVVVDCLDCFICCEKDVVRYATTARSNRSISVCTSRTDDCSIWALDTLGFIVLSRRAETNGSFGLLWGNVVFAGEVRNSRRKLRWMAQKWVDL